MEGLALAAALRPVQAHLQRVGGERLAWRFADAHTLVLPFPGRYALWIDVAPPEPRVVWSDAPLPEAGLPTPFTALLAARATGGVHSITQAALDRRFTIEFAAGEGFVPTPPVVLHCELTGRHANAILTDPTGKIVGAWREVGRDVNRYREVRPGLPYVPPPPYHKLDPRTADPDALRAALTGRTIAEAHRLIDGVGPRLAAAWTAAAGVPPREPLAGAALERAVAALGPLALGGASAAFGDPLAARRTEAEAAQRVQALQALTSRRTLVRKRLHDLAAADALAEQAETVRARATLLLARAREVPRGATRVVLEGFDHAPVEIALDPALNPFANAERMFDRARRHEERSRRSALRRPALEAALADLDARIAALPTLDIAALTAIVAEFTPPKLVPAARRRPGVWLMGPHGFEIVLGRSARENDLVTFQVGRSQDVWLHAQGVRGAHVIIRSGGRDVPTETLRFAAEIAAGHATVADEATALVDHTLRKHVWKVKGMPPGAVHYAQVRTIAVTPRRLRDTRGDEAAEG